MHLPLDRRANRNGLSRRTLVAALPLLLAACGRQGFDVLSGGDYGEIDDGGYTIPAVDTSNVEPGLMREEVSWTGREKAGSIVVNVPERKLYLIQGGGRALRYSVGVQCGHFSFRPMMALPRKFNASERPTPTE